MHMEKKSILRRESEILERLENVKRLIEMETTLLTTPGPNWSGYRFLSRDHDILSNTLIDEVRDEIQMQLLSVVALCYGDNPDVGDPMPMLCWKDKSDGPHPADRFRDVWEECLCWGA